MFPHAMTCPDGSNRRLAAAAALALLIAALFAPAAPAQPKPNQTEPLQNVAIDEHLGRELPLDLTFTDSSGETVRLGDYFKAGRPVVLNLVYYECPMLCTFALNSTSELLKEVAWTPGEQYQVVTVSFDPTEGPQLAAQKKAAYVNSLGKANAEDGWVFLTGSEQNIEKLARTVGFKYQWVPEQKEFAHATALMIATPGGKLSRYLHGAVGYKPRTFRLSVVEASDGQVGSAVENALIAYCFRYDPEKGEYAPAAFKIMRAGGVLTVIAMVSSLGFLFLRERRRHRHVDEPTASDT